MDSATTATESYKMLMLIRAFQTHGHLRADIDPLQLETVYKGDEFYLSKFKRDVERMEHLTNPQYYGFSEADLDREFYIDIKEMNGLLRKKKVWTLREIQDSFSKVYCGKIGVEFMHIPNREKCNWIRDKFEVEMSEQLSKDHRI